VLHLRSWRPPAPDETIPVYDARFIANRNDYLQGLMQQEKTVLLLFWPAFSLASWPKLQSQLGEIPLWQQQSPLYLARREGQWQSISPDSLDSGCDLVLLDVPHGLPSLERLAADLQDSLYHHRIHLLYNVNDVDRTYSFLAENGPNRTALASLYRGLKALKQPQWCWGQLGQVMQADGFLGLPDQVNFHLQVLADLALAECVCSGEGVALNWLPEPTTRKELAASSTFAQAQAKLAAFAEAREWLCGPDAGGIIVRSLRSLISVPVSG
jgi:hypothetical protein